MFTDPSVCLGLQKDISSLGSLPYYFINSSCICQVHGFAWTHMSPQWTHMSPQWTHMGPREFT